MRKSNLQRLLIICTVVALTNLLMLTSVSAAPLARDPAKGYATALPVKTDAGVLVYEDFEGAVKDDDGYVGKFSGTQPDDSSIPAATIEVVTGTARSGSSALKVSKRGVSALGSPMGYNTVAYRDIGLDIADKYEKDLDNRNKTDTYFISAWVKNVDPSVTQYFWLQLQYGGSGEVWLPGQTYFKVSGSEWTQIGIAVAEGNKYYVPFIEDSTKSAIYPPRSGISTWSALKFITRNPKNDPKDQNEPMIQTNYDFYVDDIMIWKVDDASKLVAELPSATSSEPVSSAPSSAGSSAVSSSAVSTVVSQDTSNGISDDPGEDSSTVSTDDESYESGSDVSEDVSETVSTDVLSDGSSEESQPSDPDKNGLGGGAVAAIVAGSLIVAGAGGFLLYKFLKNKKSE